MQLFVFDTPKIQQVDLFDWIRPLNVMDSVFSHILNIYSTKILLLPSFTNPLVQPAATSMEQIQACPMEIIAGVVTMLQFTTVLLSNATSKHLYSSIPAVSDLLAASNETIVSAAIKTLAALSLPAASYKLQTGPDRHHHQSLITQLHQSSSSVNHGSSTNVNTSGKKFRSDVHDRLMCIARAYGTRTTGHGLYTIVTTDDSMYGQGSDDILPKSFGEIYFTYQKKKKTNNCDTMDVDDDDDEYYGTSTITLAQTDLKRHGTTPSDNSSSGAYASPSPDHSTASCTSGDGNNFASTTTTVVNSSSKKRRKVTATGTMSDPVVVPAMPVQYQGEKGQIKSTAEIFFMILQNIPGGLNTIPLDRWYALLHDIRMARHYYTQHDRCTITIHRLYALITVLHAHPSNECLSGYFSAQPDIGTDIADLLRPMVNSANISIASASSTIRTTPSPALLLNNTDVATTSDENHSNCANSALRPDAITNLVDDTNTQSVPFELRILAVEAISALITRRDGSTSMSTLSGGRLQSLLIDLGVGKGQYLGLLPTLTRYSLSALSSIVDLQQYESKGVTAVSQQQASNIQDAFDIGLTFVEATLAPSLSRKVQVQRALRFLDSVLTLTSNVIGTSSGLIALVDCGLIPALVTTISIDPGVAIKNLVNDVQNITSSEILQMKASLRYITAQAVQILEPVTATSSNALASFHDLKGVDVLIKRLDFEIKDVKRNANAVLLLDDHMEVEGGETLGQSANDQYKVLSSQRSLIFCILTCLTVVFHQESNSESSSIGSVQLRTNELTEALSEILSNVSMYGGYLASLVSTLLSDAMNNDPHIVSHVLKSGLAVSFLSLFDEEKVVRPTIPAVPELIMAIPSIISAIALTDDGSKLVADHNPFPAFLRIFYHCDYAMPQSQCLLNEMGSIIGTGLDEIIRHVERLKPLIVAAIADAMNKVVSIASDLVHREEETLAIGYTLTDEIVALENERSCLIQYILNFSQLLEQFLHSEENCEQFVDAGCFDAVLKLSRISMPPVHQFLPHISSLSAPSVSTLHHSTTEEALLVICKCLELRYNAVKVLKKLIDVAKLLLDDLSQSEMEVLGNSKANFILDMLPQEPVYKLSKSKDQPFLMVISRYLRSVANVQWITSLLANAFKSAYQRSSESSWSRIDEDWKNEVSSDSFAALIGRLSTFHTSALYEVCRVRAEEKYMSIERQRFKTRLPNVRYRLRIVCLEGAVVRDGIEIDSCLNVGSLEMGDIVEASDRCINASGILRYKTKRGWVSEMTRGHGREPISEVINILEIENEMECDDLSPTKRTEAGIPDLCNVAVTVLARCQASCAELFGALSKLVFQGIRTLSLTADLANSNAGLYISSLTKILVGNFKQAMSHPPVSMTINSSNNEKQVINDAGVALYFGSTLSLLNQCLFDEKRERRSINLPLLVSLLSLGTKEIKPLQTGERHESEIKETGRTATLGLFKAIGFVFKHVIADFSLRASSENEQETFEPEHQRVSQSVASCFPPLILLLRKFTSTPLSSSPVTSIMSRLRWKEVAFMLGMSNVEFSYVGVPGSEEFFHPESVMADLLLCLSKIVLEVFSAENIRFAPPHIVHPFVKLVGDIMTALKDTSKKKLVKSVTSASDRLGFAELLRLRRLDVDINVSEPEQFEASEESITRLVDMGFSRPLAQHALQRTRSNALESAMDHLLSTAIDRVNDQTAESEPAAETQVDIQDDIVMESIDQASRHHNQSNGNRMEVGPEIASGEVITRSEVVTTCDVLAGNELEKWVVVVPSMVCKVLSNIPFPSPRRAIQASGRIDYSSLFKENDGDGESETLTVVLSTFLLEQIQNNPEKLVEVVSLVLSHLNEKISVEKESITLLCKIEGTDEASFSALCHAVALLTRARPKSRRLLLEMGLVGKIMSCLEFAIASIENKNSASCVALTPLWFTPAILLLDIMAQPLAAFSREEMLSSMTTEDNDSELKHIQKHHGEQLLEISSIVDQWMQATSIMATSEVKCSEAKAPPQNVLISSDEANVDESISKISFSEKIPAYFSLLPRDASLRCVELCKQILLKLREPYLSTGLIQSTLFLLLRLLRSPKIASSCLHAGVAETVLGLPKLYSFIGSSGVVTLILRRLIEDESTLLGSMESDIRSTFAKLQVSTSPNLNESNPAITLTSLMEGTTHLLCRDPLLFFKALTSSVMITKLEGPPTVSLLPAVARVPALDGCSDAKIPSAYRADSECANDDITAQHLSTLSPKAKIGSRTARLTSKKGKKARDETPRTKKHDLSKSTASDIPALRIVNLLIQSIVASTTSDCVDNGENQFLPAHELIDVLSDLVLAVPTCASTVHSYRNYRGKDKRRVSSTNQNEHALQGCPSPPRTFITYLLHQVLPHDKWAIRNDIETWTREKGSHIKQAEVVNEKKKDAFKIVKTAQSTGRLLLSLVLRPGEGRKRVISDLVFALSGGRLGHGSTSLPAEKKCSAEIMLPRDADLNALHVWGELCLAIAAPKNNGKNLDGLTTLNLDNIRIMLECGMVHSLLFGLHRIKAIHPMASIVFGALFVPLEILTRGNVSDAVVNQVKKELHCNAELPSKPAILDSAFEPVAGQTTALNMGEDLPHSRSVNLAVDYEVLEDVGINGMEDMDSQDGTVEVGLEGEEDDERSSANEDSDTGDDDESDNSDDEDIDEEEMPEESESEAESSDSEDVENEAAWDVENHNSFANDGQDFEEEEEEEEVTEELETGGDEEWTRIESNGGFIIGNGLQARAGFVDAAEAMINSLFRQEDISSDALAEIEGTLGIRIMRGRNPRSGLDGTEVGHVAARIVQRHEGMSASSNNVRDLSGEIPRVHQRSQPVVGYSGFGRSAIEVSSMEYVFGGPTVTGCSENYDITSTSPMAFPLNDEYDLTHQDLHVFPNGPATVVNFHTHYSVHPLLCGVDLPPISCLVTDLLPSGARARRQPTTRRFGELISSASVSGQLFSYSNRDVIRSNRPHITGGFGGSTNDRSTGGSLGWTDDGLPVENMVQEFSSALVETYEQIARAAQAPIDENVDAVTLNEAETPQSSELPPGNEETVLTIPVVDTNEPTSVTAALQAGTTSSNEIEDGARSDGEGVVSSVAELRLSTENEETDNHHPIDSGGTNSLFSIDPITELPNVNVTGTSSADVLGHENVGNSVETVNMDSSVIDVPSSIDNANDTPSSVGDRGEDVVQPSSTLEDANTPPETIASTSLVCPPDVDVGVFHSLPLEMQQECVNQYSATQELAAQLTGSALDPEVLAALPEEMRREIIEQDRQERSIRAHEEERADPSNAEVMDNASFLATLSPDLREEILLTADQEFLNSLPPGVVAEAQILRERASVSHRRHYETSLEGGNANSGSGLALPLQETANEEVNGAASRRRQRIGKLKVDVDRDNVVYVPEKLSSPFAVSDLKVLFQAIYLLAPIQPPKLLPKMFLNFCSHAPLRAVITSTIVCLLGEDYEGSLSAIESLCETYEQTDSWKATIDVLFSTRDKFPPVSLIGVARDTAEVNGYDIRPVTGSAALFAVNLPKSVAGGEFNRAGLPPAIATRLMEVFLHLCKNPRVCVQVLSNHKRDTSNDGANLTSFDRLLELLEKPMYSNNSNNLETLLTLFEAVTSPLSHISRSLGDEEPEISERDIEAASAAGKQYIDVPQVAVSQRRLQLLCSILRMEACRDTAFTKVNTIIRRLCRVETNRGYVLAELASVAHALGSDALLDLRALRIRMDDAAARHHLQISQSMDLDESRDGSKRKNQDDGLSRSMSSSVTLSTSNSESKLLRVLQTLQVLCNDSGDDSAAKKNENTVVITEELAHLFRKMKFDDLWDELSNCLKVVQILEGVRTFEEIEQKVSEDFETNDDGSTEDVTSTKKKLRNSAAGLLARFQPSIEAFFIANACAARPSSDAANSGTSSDAEITIESLVGGSRMLEFVSAHRVLVNALIRNNYGLLEKGFRALVQVPRCRVLLDFDVKRQWFKSQVRRLRQHASRRHGSLRLHIRRKSVFEDAYHQLQPRNADEMRGRLNVTFRNEEGVDAGGLSREFFGILAKEMFNPNYALFTSTEDGCTFQPNPNSMINPDHLSYFRFVGRVVGKAVADGYLLDAHFTRSLYKHMLGIQPTHHDMEAIDPDYYRNLKTILEYNLADIGLDLTFSIEDHSFGRSQVIDLLPDGRSVAVTEENKEEYVRLVCQHRMTTSIQSQIKSYLAGFYELVSVDLIAIFSPKELELLISGLPDIDVHDLKEHTDCVGWKSTDKEILWFWNIVFGLSRNEKASFLQFVTGSSKVPLSGFAELQGMRGIQKFSIHKMNGKKGALMSAHTCFNSLDLPSYDSEDEMRQKFLLAINEGGGAFLFA